MYLKKEVYNKHRNFFKILEINENDALSNNLDDLLKLIETQRRKVARKYHLDKGGDDESMKKLNVAKEKLDEFIEEVKQKTDSKYATSSPGRSSSKEHSHTYSSSGRRGFTFSSSNGQSSYTFFSTGSSHSSHSSKENMDENHNSMHINYNQLKQVV